MNPARTILLLLAALALARPAAAQMGMPNPDLDRDGKVTLAEYKTAQTDALFDRLDKDKDGKVTRAEFAGMESMARRFGGEKGAARVAAIWQSDADKDGSISRPEMEARAARRFKGADANHDGVLDKAEQKALRAQIEREG